MSAALRSDNHMIACLSFPQSSVTVKGKRRRRKKNGISKFNRLHFLMNEIWNQALAFQKQNQLIRLWL